MVDFDCNCSTVNILNNEMVEPMHHTGMFTALYPSSLIKKCHRQEVNSAAMQNIDSMAISTLI